MRRVSERNFFECVSNFQFAVGEKNERAAGIGVSEYWDRFRYFSFDTAIFLTTLIAFNINMYKQFKWSIHINIINLPGHERKKILLNDHQHGSVNHELRSFQIYDLHVL